MKELSNKFLSLLRYVPYIIDEKPKIQWFLRCLHASFKERIEFDNPKTLDEAMRKAEFWYEQGKKRESLPNWKTKKTSQFDQRRRGFKSKKSFGSKTQNISKNNYQTLNLRTRCPKILQHQRVGIYLIILLEILNSGNLSNSGNSKPKNQPMC